MIKSPYQDELDKLDKFIQKDDLYDDYPASVAWLQTMGAALGTQFNVKVEPVTDTWAIDVNSRVMKCGSFEDIFTRRGVLGLLLNGIGRIALSIAFPQTVENAKNFAQKHGIDEKLAKHFGSIAKTVDEVRTDDEMSNKYAGGKRVVDVMHHQAYEGANQALKLMALDMKMRRSVADDALFQAHGFMTYLEQIGRFKPEGTIPDSLRDGALNALRNLSSRGEEAGLPKKQPEPPLRVPGAFWQVFGEERFIQEVRRGGRVDQTAGRHHAAILIALFPESTPLIIDTLVRHSIRNIHAFGNHLDYQPSTSAEERDIVECAARIQPYADEVEKLASYKGAHAQYVIAKAEQYYHGARLGIAMPTTFFGYDREAQFLDVQKANEVAYEISKKMIDHGIPKDIGDSLTFARQLLPLLEPFPYLDLNDRQKESPSMSRRQQGAAGGKSQKKDKAEKEKKTSGERSKDRRQMENVTGKEKEEVDEQRGGYSILGDNNIEPLKRYAYLIGPYMSRISATAGKLRRVLKINDPTGLQGAHRRGKKLNTKLLYRHRLDDFKLFARREKEKDQSYGFAVMADLSGSTEELYHGNSNRQIQDEMLAAAFLVAEVTERISEKVLCSLGFFSSGAGTVKRATQYLSRRYVMNNIENQNHGGGTEVDEAGKQVMKDLQDMEDLKVKNKTIVFMTDGEFSPDEFMSVVEAAKKYSASIAYFQIGDVSSVQFCKDIEKFVEVNAKGVKIRTRNVTPQGINLLPEALAGLMKETIVKRDI